MKNPALYDKLFFNALRIRLVEERIIDLYPSDKIQSPVHLSIGQEAVAVGICESLKKEDLLFGSYRSHAFYMAKGGSLNEMFAELYGRTTGCGDGKAGSMHLASKEVGFMGSSAVVASGIPHAVGAALAAKRLKKDQIIVAVFGDGATEAGVYHESLNMASLYKLPIIFVCENNGLAVHSKLDARQSYDILGHAESYNIPSSKLDEGYDFIQVHDAFKKVLDQTKKSGTPHFIEIQTCRYREHVGPSEDFDANYRSREDMDIWKSKDPLITDTASNAKFKNQIIREIDSAVDFAETSPLPSQEHLLTDVL